MPPQVSGCLCEREAGTSGQGDAILSAGAPQGNGVLWGSVCQPLVVTVGALSLGLPPPLPSLLGRPSCLPLEKAVRHGGGGGILDPGMQEWLLGKSQEGFHFCP